jgi:hypothetical protein
MFPERDWFFMAKDRFAHDCTGLNANTKKIGPER